MSICQADEKRIEAFIEEQLTDKRINKALRKRNKSGSNTKFIEIARSKYEPVWDISLSSQEPYATTYALTKMTQTKAGMATAKRLANQNGCELTIQSRPGKKGYIAVGIK
jgi:hypothetical protein